MTSSCASWSEIDAPVHEPERLFLTDFPPFGLSSPWSRSLLVPIGFFLGCDGLPGINVGDTVVKVLMENGVVPDPLPATAFPKVKLTLRECDLGVVGASVAGGVGAIGSEKLVGIPTSRSGY